MIEVKLSTRIKIIVVTGDDLGEIKSWVITRHSIHGLAAPSATNDHPVPLKYDENKVQKRFKTERLIITESKGFHENSMFNMSAQAWYE